MAALYLRVWPKLFFSFRPIPKLIPKFNKINENEIIFCFGRSDIGIESVQVDTETEMVFPFRPKTDIETVSVVPMDQVPETWVSG